MDGKNYIKNTCEFEVHNYCRTKKAFSGRGSVLIK